MAHLSKPKTSEIKSLFSTGSIFVDTLTEEKGILAAFSWFGRCDSLRKSSKICGFFILSYYFLLKNMKYFAFFLYKDHKAFH